MSTASLFIFILLAGVAAYIQTLTGFAFGLIMMGTVALLGLMPLPEAAVFVGLLSLVNSLQMVRAGWHRVRWPEVRLIVITSLPAILAGYALLLILAASRIDLLRLVLGGVIMVASLQLVSSPEPFARRSSSLSFSLYGLVSGLMSGLFSTGGPPLVYHLYRQPWPAATVRETLAAAFGLSATVRMGLVAANGDLPPLSHGWALLAIPAVAVATYAVGRWPPNLSPGFSRRMVFGLLFLSGLSLAAPPVLHALGLVPA